VGLIGEFLLFFKQLKPQFAAMDFSGYSLDFPTFSQAGWLCNRSWPAASRFSNYYKGLKDFLN